MALLNKNNIKDKFQVKSKVVSFDDFEIKIIKMGLPAILEMEELHRNKASTTQIITNMILRCCVDENNQPLFNELSIKDLPPDIGIRLFNECNDFNAMNESLGEEKAKNS